jgi:hypothetical protein
VLREKEAEEVIDTEGVAAEMRNQIQMGIDQKLNTLKVTKTKILTFREENCKC